jgi:hypothetical protein
MCDSLEKSKNSAPLSQATISKTLNVVAFTLPLSGQVGEAWDPSDKMFFLTLLFRNRMPFFPLTFSSLKRFILRRETRLPDIYKWHPRYHMRQNGGFIKVHVFTFLFKRNLIEVLYKVLFTSLVQGYFILVYVHMLTVLLGSTVLVQEP